MRLGADVIVFSRACQKGYCFDVVDLFTEVFDDHAFNVIGFLHLVGKQPKVLFFYPIHFYAELDKMM